ncbi:MAG: tetratricopeptide repeat protein [Bacteriovoracaceae bacterium]|nr:tetratricopeptide repeat protein [Bacteriovoracaceae bacterium]
MIRQIVPVAFQDPLIRELAGVISYQLEDYNQALFFAEDIDSSTIHNLRGNELLKQKNYAQAWEEFQQALRINRYSHNALERSIPLAIKGHHWEEGLKFTATSASSIIDPTTLALLRSYFLLSGKQASAAKRVLAELGNNHHFQQSLRYQLLMAYFAFLDKNPGLLASSVTQACRLDAHFCWPLATFLVWPSDPQGTPSLFQASAGPTMPQPEEIVTRLRQAPPPPAFAEEAFISQEQIDNLDQMPLILNP